MFRPLKKIEKAVRKDYETAIFSKFELGKYVGHEQVGNILNTSFSFYEQLLHKHLTEGASIDMLADVLGEYDYYYELSVRYKSGQLSSEEESFWEEYGKNSKRAIKYLSEQIVNYLPNQTKNNLDHRECLSYCLIAAEEMVSSYMSSDCSYSLSPDDCTLEVKDKTNYNFLHFKCDSVSNIIDSLNMNQYFSKRDIYLSQKEVTLPMEHSYQAEILDDIFKQSFNLTYSQSIGVINGLINICKQSSDGVRYSWFNKENMISALAEDLSELNVTKEQIATIISGFTLSSSNLSQRKIFSPKQEYRALKRAFFEVNTDEGIIVLFSQTMAIESLTQLMLSACFRQFPTEWIEFNKGMSKKLDQLSNSTGKWFEDILAGEYESRGINYAQSLKKIKLNGKNINTPGGVGEIDFLAVVGNELHIVECKFVQFASEPRLYLDDKSKFTKGDKSYSAKFMRKVNWVNENVDAIKEHLNNLGIRTNEIKSTRAIMVTFFPTIAKGLIKEYDCVDFTEYFEHSL
ncbi:hypothetical protein [Vibrio harveyi]|uniref:hypothetical protein n=1 Tax=Vibrio harveyi TaxID=669 RepID=UPI0004120754|nr:hypothetical protein [Vibrio harveyi]